MQERAKTAIVLPRIEHVVLGLLLPAFASQVKRYLEEIQVHADGDADGMGYEKNLRRGVYVIWSQMQWRRGWAWEGERTAIGW